MAAVKKAHPAYDVEIVPMTTTGDINMKPFSAASDKNGIKGLFTRELEEALLDGRIDIAVHSLKDVPAAGDPRLPLVAYCHRNDPRDALVFPEGSLICGNPAHIGCSSSRRKMQLEDIYPGVKVSPVRGNVQTRLKKLDSGEFDALALAAAGLKRLSLEHRLGRVFDVTEIVPAPGQGILACQGRAGNEYDPWIGALKDRETNLCAEAERTFSSELGGGCTSPVGASAVISGNEMLLRGFFALPDGSVKIRDSITGPAENAHTLGGKLAERIIREVGLR